MTTSMRPPLLREAANLCRRLYRPGPPGIDFSHSFDPLDLEELQKEGSLGESEGATADEIAICAETSLRNGLRLCLDYMETISQNIFCHRKTVKRVNEFVRDGHDSEKWEELLFREERALKLVLQEEGLEETGSVEERLLWERSLLQVHTLVKDEVEGAARAVADVEDRRFIHI